jgi:nicotinic acid mononucleotide adenylyltransferase
MAATSTTITSFGREALNRLRVTPLLEHMRDALTPPDAIAPDTAPCVVVMCGSLNPVTHAHIALVEAACAQIDAAPTQTVAGDLPPRSRRQLVGAFMSPVNDGYVKQGLAPIGIRAAMLDAALAARPADAPYPCIRQHRWEGEQCGYVQTYLVLAHIMREVRTYYGVVCDRPDLAKRVQLHLACGADMLDSFFIPGCWELSLLYALVTQFHVLACGRAGVRDTAINAIDRHPEPLTHASAPGFSLDMKLLRDRFEHFTMPPSETSSTLVRRLLAEQGVGAVRPYMPGACADILATQTFYPIYLAPDGTPVPPPPSQ